MAAMQYSRLQFAIVFATLKSMYGFSIIVARIMFVLSVQWANQARYMLVETWTLRHRNTKLAMANRNRSYDYVPSPIVDRQTGYLSLFLPRWLCVRSFR